MLPLSAAPSKVKRFLRGRSGRKAGEPETMLSIMSDQNDKISPETPYIDMPNGDSSLPDGWLEVISMDMEAKALHASQMARWCLSMARCPQSW